MKLLIMVTVIVAPSSWLTRVSVWGLSTYRSTSRSVCSSSHAYAPAIRSGIAAGLLGPGGRDVTRLAASSPHVWGAILRQAPEELTSHLRSLERRVGELADLVEANDGEALAEWMERSRAWKLEDPS